MKSISMKRAANYYEYSFMEAIGQAGLTIITIEAIIVRSAITDTYVSKIFGVSFHSALLASLCVCNCVPEKP